MADRDNQYWQDRFIRLHESQLDKGQAYYYRLEKQFKKASSEIEKSIAVWYQRFAKNNEISLADAKQMLLGGDLKEFQWDVAEYIKFGEENAQNPVWMKELENASARVHISRLEALMVQIQQQIEVLYGNQTDDIDRLMRDIYTNGYYHTAYEIQKGFHVGYDLMQLNDKQLSQVISKPWTADNQTFRDKCWTSKQQLVNSVHTELTQSIIRGEPPAKSINRIAKQFEVSKNKAGRLVMTESAFFASAAQKDCFETLDVEQYEIVATLDFKTSEICQGLDNQIFSMKEYRVGVTAPPLHPWCRTVTVPHFDDDYGKRAARGVDGKTYYIPGDMQYSDWKKKIIQENPKAEIEFTKAKNYSADRVQFEKYKEVLGKNSPKTLDEFQNIKYTDSEKWNTYKIDYRKANAYNKIIANEPAITKDLKEISQSTGVDMVGLEYRLKTKDSYLRKVDTDSHTSLDPQIVSDTINNTNDVIRYTYQASGDELVHSYDKVVGELTAKGYSKVKVKNTWNNRLAVYKGVNCVYKHPNGQNFEVQFHTPESFALKNGELHKLYEEYRLSYTTDSRRAEIEKQMVLLSKSLVTPKNINQIR